VLDQPWLLIAVGGILGANARYLVSVWAARRLGVAFPYGTLIANVSGSILLGFVVTVTPRLLAWGTDTRLFAATGFLGAYTTFSTFAFESTALLRQRTYLRAAANLALTVLLGVLGAWLGTLAADLI
jgi:CrcB protein